jgi:two-component system chemotaxis response regulator CheB
VNPRRLVVIGGSAGGVSALLALSAGLPRGFRAPVLIVLHIGANQSVLPSLLSAHGNNPAVHAKDGQTLQDGILYVAPPDQHMLVDDGRIRLSHGSKEHHTRPAIDPLFKSAALAHGRAVIGVVLTGWLDDGAAVCRRSRTSAAWPWSRIRPMPSSRACRRAHCDRCTSITACR